MDKKTVEAYYNKNTKNWVKDISKEPNKYYYSMYFKAIFNEKLKGNNALEIGAGAGLFTFELAKYDFKNVYALDLSAEMLKSIERQRKQRRIRELNLIVGDVEKMPFTSHFFDFVTGVGVLECLQSPDNALSEIRRILKKGGRISMRFANNEGIWGTLERLKRRIGRPSDPHFTHYYSLPQVIMKLEKLGFKIEEVRGTVLFPLFILPVSLSRILEPLLIRTRIAYLLENAFSKSRLMTRSAFYSFVVKAKA
jgi:ubiquinone/menaquinone biosynthesis C-methylase UbiE